MEESKIESQESESSDESNTDSEDDSSEEDSEKGSSNNCSKHKPQTSVDDKFFDLDEMEAFLNKEDLREEKKSQNSADIDPNDDIDLFENWDSDHNMELDEDKVMYLLVKLLFINHQKNHKEI